MNRKTLIFLRSFISASCLAASLCWAANPITPGRQSAEPPQDIERFVRKPSPSPLSPQRTPGATLPVAAPQATPHDALVFRNGDLLYGRLASMDPAGGIRWKRSDTTEPIEFDPESILEIQLGDRPEPELISTNSCQIHFTNQDELQGNLVICGADKLVLETWYAGRLELPRRMVQFLIPRPPVSAPIFQGPDGFDGWTLGNVAATLRQPQPQVQANPPAISAPAEINNKGPNPQGQPNWPANSDNQWRYKNGAFYATQSASIARDVNLPDVAAVEFDLTWKGMLHIAIALYTDYLQPVSLQARENEPDFGGFYSLQLTSYTANLLPITKNDPIRYLGQASIQSFNQKNRIHVEIRANKPRQTVALLVDGALIKEWIDPERFVGSGTGLRFVHQGQGSIKLNNLKVRHWDGQFEEKPSPNPNSKDDLAKLANGDRVVGNVQTIKDGKMAFALAGSKLDIPIERVKLVEFAGQRSVRAPEDKGEIRAWFRRGGSITFRLEKWTEQEVIGSSPNFGAITFDPSAFERVQFNANPFAKPTASNSSPPAGATARLPVE